MEWLSWVVVATGTKAELASGEVLTEGRMKRTPTHEGPPGCFTLHRGDRDAMCASCAWAPKCVNASERNRARMTVQEAANAALTARRAELSGAAEEPTPGELRAIASEVAEAAGTRLTSHQREAWDKACTTIIETCGASGWDPRVYMRAQAEMVAFFCVQKKFPAGPKFFVGEGATRRFNRWITRNRKRPVAMQVGRPVEPDAVLIAGENAFAITYLTETDLDLDQAEALNREVYPEWSLAQTEGRPHVRLPALAAGMSVVSPALPHRVLAPAGDWDWPMARAAVIAFHDSGHETTEGTDAEPNDGWAFDDSDGYVL